MKRADHIRPIVRDSGTKFRRFRGILRRFRLTRIGRHIEEFPVRIEAVSLIPCGNFPVPVLHEDPVRPLPGETSQQRSEAFAIEWFLVIHGNTGDLGQCRR